MIGILKNIVYIVVIYVGVYIIFIRPIKVLPKMKCRYWNNKYCAHNSLSVIMFYSLIISGLGVSILLKEIMGIWSIFIIVGIGAFFIGEFYSCILSIGNYYIKDEMLYICMWPRKKMKISFQELKDASYEVKPFYYKNVVVLKTKDSYITFDPGGHIGGYDFINKLFDLLGFARINMYPEYFLTNHCPPKNAMYDAIFEALQEGKKHRRKHKCNNEI